MSEVTFRALSLRWTTADKVFVSCVVIVAGVVLAAMFAVI